MLNATYENQYKQSFETMDFVVKSLAEKPGRVIDLAAQAGGEHGVQALFDAVMDNGNRMSLVQALASPSLPGWVREKLEAFLYGQRRQTAALFATKKTIH